MATMTRYDTRRTQTEEGENVIATIATYIQSGISWIGSFFWTSESADSKVSVSFSYAFYTDVKMMANLLSTYEVDVRNAATKSYGSETMVASRKPLRPNGPKIREERITSWHMVAPGDHVAWLRQPSYWHHAIVVSTNPAARTLTVIEYGSHKEKSLTDGMWNIVARIDKHVEKIESFSKIFFYRIGYDEAKCFPPEIVIKRAKSRIGECKYNLITNNCEHFATWCKTGEATCTQVGRIVIFLLPGGMILAQFIVLMEFHEKRIDAAECQRRIIENFGGRAGDFVPILGTLLGRFVAREVYNSVFGPDSEDSDVDYSWYRGEARHDF